jgi:hypothetical protein
VFGVVELLTDLEYECKIRHSRLSGHLAVHTSQAEFVDEAPRIVDAESIVSYHHGH